MMAAETRRVLVVEDEALIAHDIQDRLERGGISVTGVADTGEDAISLAQDSRPDLVLMDIRLKGAMNGIQAATEIHRLLDIPVVYLTAHADRDTMERAKASGACGYLTKPLGITPLPTAVEEAIQKHRLQRQLREREAWLAATLRSVREAIAATDTEGRVLFLNPQAENLLGLSGNDWRGKTVDQLIRFGGAPPSPSFPDLFALSHSLGTSIDLPAGSFIHAPEHPDVPVTGILAVSRLNDTILGAIIVFREAPSKTF